MYPLKEVLLLVCATIAACDDFDDIVAWGEHHLDLLRRFSEFHHGIPCDRWLRALVNRVDPILFGRCFDSWMAALWPGRHDLIAIDGKTARRTHDQRKGLKALHTLSAYATNARLALAQLSVPEKTNEITAIPDFSMNSPKPSSSKARWSPSTPWAARSTSPTRSSPTRPIICWRLKATSRRSKPMSKTISAPLRPTSSSPKPPSRKVMAGSKPASIPPPQEVDWIKSERSYPGQPRFNNIKTILKVYSRAEHADRCTFDTRYYISSAALDIERLAKAVRGHWGVESMHWLLDVEFKDDLSRYRTGHGAKNMAIVRRFALGLVRQQGQGKRQNSSQERRLEHRISARSPPDQR